MKQILRLVFKGLLLLTLLALVMTPVLAAWLLPKIWRALKRVVAKIRSWLRGGEPEPGPAPKAAAELSAEETPKLESRSG